MLTGLWVAFALRVYRLGDQNVWWDEGFTIWLARQPFLEMTLGTARDTHPPLYYWLLWPWIRGVGDGEFPARFLSAAIGVLTVAIAGSTGRRIGGPWVGLLTLWILAISRFHIWWSQEIRMYVLAALGVALSTDLAIQVQRAPHSTGRWLSWALAAALMMFSLYLTIFIWIFQSLVLLLAVPRRAWPRMALAQAIVVIPFSVWLAFALPRMATWSAAAQPPSFSAVLYLGTVLWTTGVSIDLERFIAPALLVLCGMLPGMVAQARSIWKSPDRRDLFVPWILLVGGWILQPVIIWWITQPRSFLYTPRLEARYFIPSLPLFILLLAWSISTVFSVRRLRPLSGLLLLGFASLSIAVLPEYYTSRHWRADPVLESYLIHVYARPGDGVVLVSGDRFPEFLYYYEQNPRSGERPPVYMVPRLAVPVRSDTVEAELRDIVARHSRIWLARVESHLQDPEGWVQRWLDGHLYRILQFASGHNALILYATSPEVPEIPLENLYSLKWFHRLDDPQGILLGYDRIGRSFRPGEVIRVGLYVRSGLPAPVTVEWVREPDRVMAREELPPLAGSGVLRYSVELPIHPYMPSGDYALHVRTGERLLAVIRGFRVEQTLSPPSLAEIAHPMSARLGDRIRFLGYRLQGTRGGTPPTAMPGDTLLLDLYWEAETHVERSYVVFTHLIGETFNPATGNPVWAQDDQVPLEGAYPTTHWIPGQPLRDRYELHLPEETPPGVYILEIGMYLLETGERLPVHGEGADPEARRLILTPIRVIPRH